MKAVVSMDKKLYKTHGSLCILHDSGENILYSTTEGWQTPISGLLQEFIYRFYIPKTLPSAIKEISEQFKIDAKQVQNILDNLIQRKIIVHYDLQKKRNISTVGGMFNAPILPLKEAIDIDDIDVVFLDFHTIYLL
ncbi:hypothetical protein [Alkaliphilus crotonatoxidans]